MSKHLPKKKLNAIVQEYLPEHVRNEEEYQLFVSFMEAFYEYLEQPSGQSGSIRNLRSIQDIDRTLDEFVDYWHTTLAEYLPSEIAGDKRLILKHMKEVYLSKGTEKSYKFLFRILFNNDINIRYPNDNVLYASEGNWREFIELEVKDTDKSIYDLEYTTMTGQMSGASGVIENIERVLSAGVYVWRILYSIESKVGDFIEDEEILFHNGAIGTIRTVYEQGGYYTDVQSLLNTDGATLHDGYYYQKYSYVIASEETGYADFENSGLLASLKIGVWSWRDVVKKILHPAGTLLFTEFRSSTVVRGAQMSASQMVRMLLEVTTPKTSNIDYTETRDYVSHITDKYDYFYVDQAPTRFDDYGFISSTSYEFNDYGQLLSSRIGTDTRDISIDIDDWYFIKTRTHKAFLNELKAEKSLDVSIDTLLDNQVKHSKYNELLINSKKTAEIKPVNSTIDYGYINETVSEQLNYGFIDETVDSKEGFGLVYIIPDIGINAQVYREQY